MRKNILLLFLLLTFFGSVHAQSITHTKEWRQLIISLQNENWQAANKLSLSILNKVPKKELEEPGAAMVRYMYIFSEAGLMNLNRVTKAQALKKVIGLTGHMVILPAHPVSLKDDFNSIRKSNGKMDSLFVTATNKAATSIFSFEYIVLDTKWSKSDLKDNAGKNYRIEGPLKSIKVEGNMFPRFRILIDHATAKEELQ